MLTRAAILACLLLTACHHRKPVPPVCTCVLGNPDLDRTQPYDDPADCAVHGAETE